MCLCVERLFQCVGTHQWSGTIVAVFVAHLVGDVDPSVFLIELLTGAFLIENMCQVVGMKRLVGSRIQRRHGLVGHLGLDVVPLTGNILLVQKEFLSLHNDCFLFDNLQLVNVFRLQTYTIFSNFLPFVENKFLWSYI